MSGILGSAGSKSGVIGVTEINYEEGTWVGVPQNVSGSSLSCITEGYTRIGNTVHVHAALDANSCATTGGSSYIEGLPFTVGANCSGSAMKGDYTQGGSVQFLAGSDKMYITTFSAISGQIRVSVFGLLMRFPKCLASFLLKHL